MVILSLSQQAVTVCFNLEIHNASIFRVNESDSGGHCNNWEEEKCWLHMKLGSNFDQSELRGKSQWEFKSNLI
jgi:hypothetical protein